MAKYEIMETPGKKIIDLSEHNIELPTNQDQAQMAVARLRALAKSQDRKVDYTFRRLHEATNASANGANGATSIRLTEEVRSKLARIVGFIMYNTGNSPSMGDAVNMLVDHYNKTSYLDTEDKIIDAARGIIARRKAEKEAANAD